MMLKDYVDWKLTHQKKKKSRNLFDKDNYVIQNSNYANTFKATDTGFSYTVTSNAPSGAYPNVCLTIGSASDFKGKTITFSATSYYTNATKLSVRKGASLAQQGKGFAQSGDLYYSQITIPDKEYTNEVLVIMLYAPMGAAGGTVITYDNIMVNEGSEILPYEPYRK